MTQTFQAMYANLEPSELSLLTDMKRELSLNSYQDVLKQMTSVLHAFRQTLTPQNANHFIKSLPDFLKLAFVSNWRSAEKIKPVEHLDQLVTLVMTRDRKEKDFLFKSEVQTLSVIILTLKNILKLRGLKHFRGISYNLRHEIEEVPTEAAFV